MPAHRRSAGGAARTSPGRSRPDTPPILIGSTQCFLARENCWNRSAGSNSPRVKCERALRALLLEDPLLFQSFPGLPPWGWPVLIRLGRLDFPRSRPLPSARLGWAAGQLRRLALDLGRQGASCGIDPPRRLGNRCELIRHKTLQTQVFNPLLKPVFLRPTREHLAGDWDPITLKIGADDRRLGGRWN